MLFHLKGSHVVDRIDSPLRRGAALAADRSRSTSIWIATGLLVLIGTLQAVSGRARAAVPAHTDAELQQWADDRLSGAIAEHGASGIAVAIVRDGKLLYSQGYGHSDQAGKHIVDAGETHFSIGSITKSFTATAIAQLLEKGLIRSLDDPANRYLHRIQLPRKNERDVTVRDLVTHRAGFDESIYGLATFEAVPVPITPKQILERLPPIIRTPGEVSVYSNIGYGVLGVLIEDITALTYGEYLRRNVFVPLDMTHSYIRYSPQQDIAQPMEYSPNGAATPIPQGWAYHPFISSSASLVSTAQDMAKFALGQLSAESGAVPALMNAATARLMHDRSISNAPSVAGFGMSFIANTWNGTRVTENAGSGPGFQALFILLPDLKAGFVVLIMGEGEKSLKMFALREAFLDFYLGPLQPARGPLAGEPIRRYVGIYRSERRPHSTSEAVFSPGTTLDVTAQGDDALTINGQQGYREIAAGTFWKPGVVPYVPNDASSDMYVFVRDSNGKIKYVAPYLAVDVYKPACFDPATLQTLTIALCLACATGLLAFWWPIASTVGRLVRLMAILLGAAAPAVPLVLAQSLRIYGGSIFMIGFGHMLPLQIATALATGCAVFAILLAALTILGSLRPKHHPLARSRIAKGHLISLSIAGIALTAAFAHYNLIGNHVP